MTEKAPTQNIQEHLNDAITKHMKQDFCRLFAEQQIHEALETIRKNPTFGRILYFYVVDAENHLQGVVPTRRLLLSPLDKKISEIMIKNVITISEKATVLEACEFFTMHRLLAFPVVDAENRILGVVDVELYTNEIIEMDRSHRDEDLFQLVGIHLKESQQNSPWISFRSRFPWLLCNIAGGMLAAFLSNIFEAELTRVVALALFIPIVLALAESVSIQSLTLALRVMHGQKTNLKMILRKLQVESLIGILLGSACAFIVGAIAALWLGQAGVVVCLLGGIIGGVSCAALIGVSIPNFLHLVKLDPQVASGPIALATADMVTLSIYFLLARWWFAP